jgi:hypothetical protein
MPGFIRSPLSVYRRHVSQKSKDNNLNKFHEQYDLKQITSGCLLLADRLELLYKLPANSVVAEVGVAQGEFSDSILKITSPSQLYLIDSWGGKRSESGKIADSADETKIKAQFATQINERQVVLSKGISWEVMSGFAEATFDWIYIDAAHDFDSVCKDLDCANRIVKVGGYICGHDYTRWGSKGLGRFGVVEAVNNFCQEHGYSLYYLTNEPHRHLSYAIRKSA